MPAPVPPEERMAYKMATAATLLDCSRAYLYKLAAQGDVQTVTIGRSRRIPRAELERLATEGTA